ncbi:MAG: hypothetical protein IPP40_06195 [bacterium]|nr:hypothetical protein [bacterium]
MSLYLERLLLDDLLFLETELNRRKERFRREHVVMAIQSEQKLLTTYRRDKLEQITKELRRFINECAVAGSGVQLAFSPDVSLLLFRDVPSASKTASHLLTGLAELNGKLAMGDNRISLKMGLSCGSDVLAAGSMRSVRQSALVRRASQCAWKAPGGALLIDENSMNRWEPRHEPMRIPIDIDGVSVYKVSPNRGEAASPVVDENHLLDFLKQVAKKRITTLKYSLLREEAESDSNSAWSRPVARAVITLEAFDPGEMRNISHVTKCALSEYAGHVDRIRRLVSDLGLGLVKHEEASSISAG